MPSVTPDRSTALRGDDTQLRGSKRRRTSDRTELTVPSEASDAISTARGSYMTTSPQPGSSREMSPPESTGPVKYTRTGRVSKATKGQRIHQCDECGKIYTRAEHLRRHQQNHKPGAFPCDVPGCGRSFYREDLLTRHKARHDDPFDDLSQHGSPASHDSAPTTRLPSHSLPQRPRVIQVSAGHDADTESVNAPRATSRAVGQQSGDLRTKDRYLNLHDLQQRSDEVAVDVQGACSASCFGGFQQWEPSPPYSPTTYDSPSNKGADLPYFQPHIEQVKHNSHASFFGPNHTSRSPVSAGSSNVHLPQLGPNAHNATYASLNTSSGSEASHGDNLALHNCNMAVQPTYLGLYSTAVWTAEDRDFMEQDELITSLNASQHSSMVFDEDAASNEDKYLNTYWTWRHPFQPIIHRPSFDVHQTSPLLKAAMLALGAQACNDVSDKQNGRQIHEKCMKVLQKRTLNEWHTYRTCDMQAIVSIELYSVYKSRRPPLQLSKIFGDVYEQLANDPSVVNSEILDGPMAGTTIDSISSIDDFAGLQMLDIQVRKRLLMICFMLDVQHATLFGRQRTACFTGAGLDMPFPECQSVWDAPNIRPTRDETSEQKVWQAISDGSTTGPAHPTYDFFQSILILAAVCDGCPGLETLSPEDLASQQDNYASLFAMTEQSPRSKLAYHTGKMCKLTPMCDLLAVAGESWVMSEKLETAKQFADAQQRCKEWASAKAQEPFEAPVQRAVRHALKVLEVHQNFPKTGTLFQEWSIYIASVVIWARASTTFKTPQRMPRLSVPQPAEPRMSTQEIERAASTIIASGASELIDSEQAKHLLLWTKMKIEKVDVPHVCGLTNGALDVLGKLITRGNEDGWFGS